MTDPKNKTELSKEIERAHQDMLRVLALMGDAEKTAPILQDGWSVKDSLAHLAAWENVAMDRIAVYKRGEEPTSWLEGFSIDENGAADQVEKINTHLFERNKNRALDDVLRDFHAAYQRAVETVDALTQDEIFDPDHFPMRDHQPLLSVIANDTYAHYDEHIDWIRERFFKNV